MLPAARKSRDHHDSEDELVVRGLLLVCSLAGASYQPALIGMRAMKDESLEDASATYRPLAIGNFPWYS